MRLGTFFYHLAEFCTLLEGQSIEKCLETLVLHGLACTDVDNMSIEKYGVQYIRKIHEDFGMRPASMFYLKEFPYEQENALEAVLEETKKQLADCAAVGAPLFMPVPYAAQPVKNKAERDNRLLLVTSYLHDVAELAKPYGITVVLENYSDIHTPFSYPEDIKHILRVLPSVGYVLDTGNYWFGGSDLVSACREFASQTLHVHLKEVLPKENGEITVNGRSVDSVAIGDGVLPNREVLELLRQYGYDKTVTIELTLTDKLIHYISKSLVYLREILE